ncbi:MAG TPA: SagB family peptide dehydrogenase, partial [Verrucomicrobiaceae bacterium]
NVPLRQWEFHDLLFHSRSRMGRHRHPFGGTWRFSGALPPLPALKPPMSTQRITLHHPDLQALETSDASFSHVSEARCSVRERGEKTISAAQLGEFLHRSARMKELRAADPENPRSYDVALGPCASGGALHELELYLAVWSCAGLEPGLYHYDPMAHELELLTGLGPGQRQLLFGACQSSGTETPPDVLINIAARFQRASWKYQSMAYALILKNAGALYQQMYLVATAMNLAPCGLGGGNSDLFAEAANLDYWEETSVGEFMLSGR